MSSKSDPKKNQWEGKLQFPLIIFSIINETAPFLNQIKLFIKHKNIIHVHLSHYQVHFHEWHLIAMSPHRYRPHGHFRVKDFITREYISFLIPLIHQYIFTEFSNFTMQYQKKNATRLLLNLHPKQSYSSHPIMQKISAL